MPLGLARMASQLLVGRIHPATQDTRVDLREQIEGIFPRLYPIQFSVGPLDEVVHRYPQSCDYFSHVNSPYVGDLVAYMD